MMNNRLILIANILLISISLMSAAVRNLEYKCYYGEWDKLPEFKQLEASSSGSLAHGLVDLSVAGRDDYFAMVFTGKLDVARSGAYTFYISSDDGSRLFVNGKMLVDYDGLHGTVDLKEGSIELSKGVVDLEVHYLENASGQDLQLGWSGPGLRFTQLSKSIVQNYGPTYTDARIAREEHAGFMIQGDYVKQMGEDYAAQVIAYYDEDFQMVLYAKGLPGMGWDGVLPLRIDGSLRGHKAVFDGPGECRTEIVNGVMSISDSEGSPLHLLNRIERKSSTLGQAAPPRAKVLFDGSSADNFKDGRLSPDGYLMHGTVSKEVFKSHRIHIEFCLPYKPGSTGQHRGNSGIFVQGRYEVQMLDSYGLSGEHNECGGIYSINKPRVNMCFPPLSWQTYDIEFTAAVYKDGEKVENARISVRHNGVLVQDDVEITRHTPAGRMVEGPGPGPIYLQDHDNPVVYRNIWVEEY